MLHGVIEVQFNIAYKINSTWFLRRNLWEILYSFKQERSSIRTKNKIKRVDILLVLLIIIWNQLMAVISSCMFMHSTMDNSVTGGSAKRDSVVSVPAGVTWGYIPGAQISLWQLTGSILGLPETNTALFVNNQLGLSPIMSSLLLLVIIVHYCRCHCHCCCKLKS